MKLYKNKMTKKLGESDQIKLNNIQKILGCIFMKNEFHKECKELEHLYIIFKNPYEKWPQIKIK